MTRILAIDPSLTCTGFCTPERYTRTYKPNTTGMARLDAIADLMLTLAAEADVVMIESPISHGHSNTLTQLGGLAAVIRLELYRAKTPYVDVSPSQRMKFATGKGNATKQDVLLAAVRRFGYAGNSDDEADALVLWEIGDAGYHQLSDTVGARVLTQYQLDVLGTIQWPEIDGHTPNWPAAARPRKKAAA